MAVLLGLGWATPVAARGESRQIALGDLGNVQVPSLCGHPAGQLVDGHLPGIAAGQGAVWFTGKAAIGQIQPGQAPGAVAAMGCDQGGVGWPDTLVMYDAQGNLIGHRGLATITRSGRETVRRVRIGNGQIRVQVIGMKTDADDCEACAQGSALVTLRWAADRGQFVVEGKRIFRERSAAVRTVRAVREGRRKVALRHSSRRVVDQLFRMRQQKGRLSMGPCIGRNHEGFPAQADMLGRYHRVCFIFVSWPRGYESAYALFLSPATWKTWKGRKLVSTAG
jgi:hypothetical protein